MMKGGELLKYDETLWCLPKCKFEGRGILAPDEPLMHAKFMQEL
jgi:hypothetical protein